MLFCWSYAVELDGDISSTEDYLRLFHLIEAEFKLIIIII